MSKAEAPIPTDYPQDAVVQRVKADLEERSAVGFAKYGRTLATAGYSVRRALQDAYEETLDTANYLKLLIMIHDGEIPPGQREDHARIDLPE